MYNAIFMFFIILFSANFSTQMIPFIFSLIRILISIKTKHTSNNINLIKKQPNSTPGLMEKRVPSKAPIDS